MQELAMTRDCGPESVYNPHVTRGDSIDEPARGRNRRVRAVEYVRRLTIYSVMPALCIPLGIWLLASPYFLQFTIYEGARMNAAGIGPFIVGFALTRLAVSPPWYWVGWINVLLGVWIFIVPFALGLSHITDLTLNFVIVGALVVIFSVLGQFEKVEVRQSA